MQLLRFCKVVLTIVFSAALAKSFDGDHSEPSLLTWGISESEVLDLASNHRQEAIFRLTPDEVEIVGTYQPAADRQLFSRSRLTSYHTCD